MKTHTKVLIFVIVSLLSLTAYSKSSKKPKASKVVKEAVNTTAKQKEIYLRISLGKTNRLVWNGYYKNRQGMRFMGIGTIPDEKSGKIENEEKKKYFYDGEKYFVESKTDEWDVLDSSKINNFGASRLNGNLIKNPMDLFNLIKKYSMDDIEYAKESENENSKTVQIIAKKDEKKSAKFIDYHTFWKELKKEEHWKDSKISSINVQTIFTIDKESELLKTVKFEYKVEFICNYGKGETRCMGCINEIGDVITYEFLDESQIKLELPDSLKRKLGIKDVAEAKDGLKLSLSVSKARINKGESIEFEVTWENVSKKDIKIKRVLKTNPYTIFKIDGELESSKGRFDSEEEKKPYADDKPLVLKAGKKYKEVFTMESDGRIADDETIRFLKTGKFYIKAFTKLDETGLEVESNSIEVNIIP